ncbi:DNA mismatch repair protein MutL [Candidatus Nitrosoglobus terrae]|uniref:DNA mismatch repair protein MutL n=1 Tax=Candidatus Nitrosoglobus terrae TaxID=1630141 RepID=A0A1Q2SPI6_9GAMM|nr:DNA mismatch repair endonuclease MutL [Candidatus Nitrosoglobus terrae]BAW81075.1 DNA mismatch repair protein MutL [Candidatus Nitrosoglobus terrae]
MTTPTVPRIQRLSPALASQIAAGEVVERPASVLKELIENSLDAGAQHIEIESEAGGIGLIRIRDDGYGIHPEDLSLALSSRATSKIHRAEELLAITTLGFRGEALASIQAVSRLSLSSRIVDANHGWRIQENRSPQPIAHPVGTTVEVRDLFYNTPARRRFLREEKTEFIRLKSTLTRLALSHFNVGFRANYNGRPLLALPAHHCPAERLKRVAAVYGQGFVANSLYVEQEQDELRLWGWIGNPAFSCGHNNLQYFYTNHRMVRDRLLTQAARQAYGNRLPQGRHPAYLLYLELPPNQLDVNAHPTKNELRFRQARQVHSFIVRTLIEVLKQPELQGQSWLPVSLLQSSRYPNLKEKPAKTTHTIAEHLTPYHTQPLKKHVPEATEDNDPLLGQAQTLVLNRYLLAENKTGLILVDTYMAKAHLTQTRLQIAYANDNITQQPLLFPLTLNVLASQAEWVELHGSKLLELGFGLYRLGPELLILREAPTQLKGLNFKSFLHALLLQLTTQPQKPLELAFIREGIINLIGSHLAPSTPPLSLPEMNALLRDLEHFYQHTSTLNRKLPWREFPKDQIEAWFSSPHDQNT